MNESKRLKKLLAGIAAVCVTASAIPAIPTMAASLPLGDVDLSGTVDVFDQVILRKYILQHEGATLSGNAALLADVNQDTFVDIVDAVALGRSVVTGKVNYLEVAEDITYIHLGGTSITVDGVNAVAQGSKVTISASGTYYIDGSLNDGQIIVNVADETVDTGTVKLFLNGVDIKGVSQPAIYIENAENTSINLVSGKTNVISDGTTAYAGDYLECAVIHAKDDMTIKGDGALEINAVSQYAIHCNNDIKFNGGTVNITTELEDAVRGKSSVTVKDGVINIDSAADGIKSSKGDVSIEGGAVQIKAGNDAIQAETTIDISGGNVTASGDRGLTGVTGVNITGGTVVATATDNQAELINATQGTMLLNCIDDTSNTDGCWKKANAIAVSDSITASPLKKFKYVLISDASIKNGTTYTLTNKNTSSTVTHTNGASKSFAMSALSTTFNSVNLGATSQEVTADGYRITLSSNGISTNAPAETASVADGVITVKQPGVFAVTGSMNGGQIAVNVDKTAYPDGVVELELSGAELTNTNDSPIYVESIGDEVQLVAKSGTVNTISDGTSYTNSDSDNGAIYSKDDLKIKGKGTLVVNGNCQDGIVCKNDLKIYNGNIIVNAVDDAVRGKDSVTVGNANDTDFSTLSLTVKSTSGDGIKSTETDTTTGKGNVTINGGTLSITAYSDGIHASQVLDVNGGDITIETTCPATTSNSGNTGGWFPGGSTSTTDTAVSAKGLKAGTTDDTTSTEIKGVINVNSGNINIDSTDDCIHANGNIALVGGKLELTSSDDAVHTDADLVIGKGSSTTYDDIVVVVHSAYEGMEGLNITQNSGTVISNTTDDGYNAAGGTDGSGNMSPGGWGGGFGSASGGNYSINLKGGFALVNVTDGDHDGFDSNGSLTISDGIAISNGNEPFDCDGTKSYAGGVYVINKGSGGMGGMGGSEMTSTVKASCSASSGTRITLADNSKVIVSFLANKNVSTLTAGCKNNTGAKFYTGGTVSGTELIKTSNQSIYTDGTLSGGTQCS